MPPSKPLPTSMVAWQHNPGFFSGGSFTSSSYLKLNQVAAAPTLKKSQTLIKVLTAGLNPVDYKLASIPGLCRLAMGSAASPGMDYVGRVWGTTLPDSAGIKAGDLVFGKTEGMTPFGTLAGYTVITGEEGVAKAPEGVDLDWLASVGVAALTAYQSIVPKLETNGEGSAQGKSVLINGASGGVGTFTVQIAKAIGCQHIVAVCSGANADLVKSLGATEVIDYRSQNVADAAKSFCANTLSGKKFDLVVDNVGADLSLYYHAHEYLTAGVPYVFVGATISLKAVKDLTVAMTLPPFLGGSHHKLEFLGVKTNKAQFEKIGRWMAEGKVKAIVDSTFSMNEVLEAYKKLKTGRARGNIVVRVSEDGRGDS